MSITQQVIQSEAEKRFFSTERILEERARESKSPCVHRALKGAVCLGLLDARGARGLKAAVSSGSPTLANFHSMVFIEIPATEISDPINYMQLAHSLEKAWMEVFNKNPYYRANGVLNDEEGYIGGNFGELYFGHCKFHRYNGTKQTFHASDWRGKRGFLIRDHESSTATAKVHILTQERISYKRVNFDKERRPVL